MRASNKLVISLITLVLTGCAAIPKPEMPEQKYMEFAQLVNAIDWCINKYFSMEAHTASIRVMGTVINTWNYDSAKLRETSRNNPVSITETECNRIAANILATQQRGGIVRRVWPQVNQRQLLFRNLQIHFAIALERKCYVILSRKVYIWQVF